MREDLLTYYERELAFLRQSGSGFAETYPKVAGRLRLEAAESKDPHVERLIEAFAFIAARVQLKLDDEFPEITESLLQVMYPHYLAPLPAMSIAQFHLDPKGQVTKATEIERNTDLVTTSGGDAKCRFRTCYPVSLWPITVAGARLEAVEATSPPSAGRLVLDLKSFPDVRFKELAKLDRLRFFLDGDSELVHRLYELILGHCCGVEIWRDDKLIARLDKQAVAEVGFGRDEGMLPYSSRSFLGYRLLTEYFHFPQKFLFFDLSKLACLAGGEFDQAATVVLLLDERPRVDRKIAPQNFLLGCAPVVNLFTCPGKSLRYTQRAAEYRVIPDRGKHGTTEVYGIDSVSSVSPSTARVTAYQPFYSFKHSFDRVQQRAFWHASRRPSEQKGDKGTEVFLTLVDLDFRPTLPADEVLTLQLTATNRDRPADLSFRNSSGDFELEQNSAVRRISCLIAPTRAARPPLRHGAQWRLISHLSLNFLSPTSAEGGNPEILQEILKLYDFSDSPAVRDQILGVTSVRGRQVWRRIRADHGSGFGRGIEATVEFNEAKFQGSSVFLFSSVLEKFFALYVSINSFSETIATIKDRGVVTKWPPRSGLQALL